MENNGTKLSSLYTQREQVIQKIQRISNLAKGSLYASKRYCGKKNCKCYKNKEKHTSLFWSYKENNKTKLIPVKQSQEKTIKKWLNNHKELKGLISKLTYINTSILKTGGI